MQARSQLDWEEKLELAKAKRKTITSKSAFARHGRLDKVTLGFCEVSHLGGRLASATRARPAHRECLSDKNLPAFGSPCVAFPAQSCWLQLTSICQFIDAVSFPLTEQQGLDGPVQSSAQALAPCSRPLHVQPARAVFQTQVGQSLGLQSLSHSLDVLVVFLAPFADLAGFASFASQVNNVNVE